MVHCFHVQYSWHLENLQSSLNSQESSKQQIGKLTFAINSEQIYLISASLNVQRLFLKNSSVLSVHSILLFNRYSPTRKKCTFMFYIAESNCSFFFSHSALLVLIMTLLSVRFASTSPLKIEISPASSNRLVEQLCVLTLPNLSLDKRADM